MVIRPRPAARAVLLTEDWRVLLVRLRLTAPDREIWITPGGGIDQEEPARTAVAREVWEETGLRVAPGEIGPELWIREHEFTFNGEVVAQREQFFLIPVEHYEPRIVHLDEGDESEWFQGFEWWSIEDIPLRSERFAPTGLGVLLRKLREEGPPSSPQRIEG